MTRLSRQQGQCRPLPSAPVPALFGGVCSTPVSLGEGRDEHGPGKPGWRVHHAGRLPHRSIPRPHQLPIQPPVTALQLDTQGVPSPVTATALRSTGATGWDVLSASSSGAGSGQRGQEQEGVLPSGFWQAFPQAAGQHLRVLSQSPSDWHPTVQFTASIAGSGHTPAFAARQRRRVWVGAGAAGPAAGRGLPSRGGRCSCQSQGWVQGCC